ncbi:PD-(D/E)XK nuclease superfamily protein [Geodermatophilus obscurus]|uniref:PD-(D/E)XK nuclease superfamily protein n=1 Tax=Geodermatophilus obscurus TaxID=1861 RepID=A0A1M7TUM1_9ACTN|nr:PD-(D/E)XK nuclease family protein [Geodermatophilus obscurus]SHN74449.1 PD-(D/E)XK nuclease superfamily protein [Geodermatophilus obscurus]
MEAAQLEMPGMPRRLFPATPSKLAAFSDCPRRYRHAYVDRPTPAKGPAWAHNSMGSAVHAALRSWWELPLTRRTPGAARQLLYGVWSTAGFRDAEQSERWRARAAGWLTDYVTGLDPADEPVGTERQVAATTERLALSGRVDRIDQRGDELVVVDYKTGRSVCTDDEARGSPALAAYVLGVRRTLRRPCNRVELHHLPTGTVAAFEHTDRSLANHVRRAEDVAADIAAATAAVDGGEDPDVAFPAAPGRQCGWCDFRPSCSVGQAATPPRESWSFLAEETAAQG